MLIGYNTNVPYKGKMYHVQTEDTGQARHTLVTLLYYEGAILRSQKTSYAEFIGRPDFKERVRELMKEQHKAMIKGLIAGRFEEEQPLSEEKVPGSSEAPVNSTRENSEPETEGEAGKPSEQENPCRRNGKSLDDIFREHISRKVKDG
ncbi:MAG TPA: hypothetical protein VFG09_04825 [Thermodesulfovibrionales bacterium]|jgi:hypothetical protein|nr:hypothetical protein [Thermodesulfovibrionales bacterium]